MSSQVQSSGRKRASRAGKGKAISLTIHLGGFYSWDLCPSLSGYEVCHLILSSSHRPQSQGPACLGLREVTLRGQC